MNKKNGLSRYRQEKIMRAFCADLTATQAALILDINRNTANRYYSKSYNY
jgi:transposase-like protein